MKKPDQTPGPVPPTNRELHPRNLPLAAAVVVLAVCVAGGAIAISLTRTSGSSPQVVVTQTKRAAVPARAGASPARAAAARPRTASPPRTGQEAAAIDALFEAYYGAVSRGDFDTAWSLLTPSYKAWKANNGGRPEWESLEADNQEHLDSSGLRVEEIGREPSTGATIVAVSGMVYTRPGSHACAYEGVTWVRRSGSQWLYDQGYLQDPARARSWRPKRFRTLGYSCTPNGY